jgi:hypothetical protein
MTLVSVGGAAMWQVPSAGSDPLTDPIKYAFFAGGL